MNTAAPREMRRCSSNRPQTRTRRTAGATPAAITAEMKIRMSTPRTRHNNKIAIAMAATIATFLAKVSSSPRRGTNDTSAAEILSDRAIELRLRHGADDASTLDAVLEKDEQRNALHTETRRRSRVLIDVQLRHAHVRTL